MLLMYGPLSSVSIVDKCTVYNFTTLSEKLQNINIVPPNELGASSEYDFDVKYMNYIFNNDIIFAEFMKIALQLYYGNDVFLAVSDDPWSQILTESLMKLFQQRYGIIGVRIDSLEDFVYAGDTNFVQGYGLYNIDQDKERYVYMYQLNEVRNGRVDLNDEY